MGEWAAATGEELLDILSMYYPSGTFRLGIDSETLYIVPSEMNLADNIKVVEESIPINEIPAYLGLLGFPEKIYVWVDEASAEFVKEEEEAGRGEKERESPSEEDEMSFLVEEIQRVKKENAELDQEVYHYRTSFQMLTELYVQLGGDERALRGPIHERTRTIIEFIRGKIT